MGRICNGLYTLANESWTHFTAYNANVEVSKAELWHYRLGHLHQAALIKLARENLVDGLTIKDVQGGFSCDVCIEAKQHHTPMPKTAEHRAAEPLELVHSDLCGPIEVNSLGGSVYFVTFTDDG